MESLINLFEKLFAIYEVDGKIGSGVKNSSPVWSLVCNDLPQKLKELSSEISFINNFNGSCGKGRKSGIPWVYSSNLEYSKSASQGIYLVYLIPTGSDKLYLALSRSADEAKQKDKKNWRNLYDEERNKVEEIFGVKYRYDIQNMSMGKYPTSEEFRHTTLCYIEYDKKDLREEDLVRDYVGLSRDYESYLTIGLDGIKKQNNKEMETKSLVGGSNHFMSSSIYDHLHSNGFIFESSLIYNFYVSLKTKPFVLLAGISGTGKTRLARLFAEAVGANSENGRYLQVPVRPDWSDSSDLFGHLALDGSFRKGPILDFIIKANQDLDKPYFLCLDEMNLARVEYYFSDFLSVIETRDLVEGKIVSDSLVPDLYNSYRESLKDKESVPEEIYFSENLYIIGTVNMDESTFPFSKKVLDRAMTIEFSDVNLLMDGYYDGIPTKVESLDLNNNVFKSLYVNPKDIPSDKHDRVKEIAKDLEEYNKVLNKAQLHVGYRVRNEIIYYILYAEDSMCGIDAMDYALMQKILPRIQGSGSAIKDVLVNLYNLIRKTEFTADNKALENIDKDLASDSIKKINSAKKIRYMLARLDDDGYTAYWL